MGKDKDSRSDDKSKRSEPPPPVITKKKDDVPAPLATNYSTSTTDQSNVGKDKYKDKEKEKDRSHGGDDKDDRDDRNGHESSKGHGGSESGRDDHDHDDHEDHHDHDKDDDDDDDDDNQAIRFSIAADKTTISEEAGEPVTFTITLTGFPLNDDHHDHHDHGHHGDDDDDHDDHHAGIKASVDVTAGGTADGGADYTPAVLEALQTVADATAGVSFNGTTLTFDKNFDGSTLAFTVRAVDDNVPEDTENITVTLRNATISNRDDDHDHHHRHDNHHGHDDDDDHNTATIGTAVASVDITDNDVNDAPALTDLGGVLAYTENAAATVIDGAIMLTDVDDTQMASALVTISAGFTAGDVLGFVNTGTITGSYNAGTGVLTLSGPDTKAVYEAALESVTYHSTSADPTATSASRTISWTVTDADSDGVGAQTSAVATSTINITAVNDAPALTDLGGVLAYTENAAATVIDGAITLTDVDDTQMASALVTISAGFTAGDVLGFVNTGTITGSYNAGTGVLTLSGPDTKAAYEAALESVTYHSTSADPTATSASRTISWTVTDADSDGVGAQTSAVATSTINITAVNDAPALTDLGGVLAYTENAAATVIDGAIMLTDVDDTQMASALVTISAGFTAGDVLGFVNTGTITGSYNAGTGVLTLSGPDTKAVYEAALESVTYHSTSADPTATSASRTISWTVTDADSDGVGAQTSAVATSTINITAVNDAPALTDLGGVLAYTENAAATVIDGAITLTDVDDTQMASALVTISAGFTAGDVLGFVNTGTITGSYNAGTGVLTLSGPDTKAAYEAALESVTYHSTSADPTATSASRTISWTVTDADSDGVGAQTSAVATSTINITAVNNAPIVFVPTLDIVIANLFSDTVHVLTGNDAGGFAPAVLFASGGSLPFSVALGDVNGDGLLDIVTANYGSDSVGVLAGDGTGGFAPAATFATGGVGPFSMALGDVTGDGVLDIVTANYGSNDVSVLAGDGTGGFDAAVPFATGGVDPRSMALGDVTGDGVLDIVTANAGSNDVSVLAGNGTGGFDAAATYATGGYGPYSVALGDVTGDGVLDIVTANGYSNDVSVLASDGTGGFAPAATYATGGSVPISVALGDVNGDGVLDIVTANGYSNDVSVLTGNDAGGFAPAVTVDTGGSFPISVALGDVNGDGLLDIVTANYGSANVSVLAGDGAGGFAPAATVDSGGAGPISVALGDVDGSSLRYTENQAPTAITEVLRVTDVDSTTLTGATVSITGHFDGTQDVLGFSDTGGITGSYDDGTGVLTLTGTATLAAYQAALRSVTYVNTSDDPSGDPRTVSYQVDDGAAVHHASNIATATITVVAVNDAPVTDLNGSTAGDDSVAAFTEDGGAVLIAPAATIADVDDTHLEALTITLTSRPDGNGVESLSLNTAAATAATGLTVGYTAETGVLSISGTASKAVYASILQGVQYNNTDQDPTTTDRTVTVVVNDGTDNSAVHTATITVVAVNDAPLLFVPTLDLVTANAGSDDVSVLTGDDAGGFDPADTFATVGSRPVSVALGDVNGDGFLDLVTANAGSDTVSVLAGDGTGGFDPADTFATGGSFPFSVALGDVNGDGFLDLVTANYGSDTVSVLAGDGAGSFDPADTFATVGSGPYSVALGDVNGDGFLDLVTANYYSDNVSVLAGDGTGSFDPAITFATVGSRPYSVALGDVNGDGFLDLVTANYYSADVSVLAGDGTGGFDPAITFATGGTGPFSVALGDVNGDGFLDLVTANRYSNDVSVLAGDGTGGFDPAITFATGGSDPFSVALGDVNGDGFLDLVTANYDSTDVSVLAGDGAGSFDPADTFATGGSGPRSVALGDVDTSSLHYTENQAPTAIHGAVRVTDVDSTMLTGATVSITGHFHATEDILGFIDTGTITGSYDAITGVLTLTGTDSLAAYQAALRSVTYVNSSDDPSGDQRTVSYQVDDGAPAHHASNIATATITVVAVNDAPILVVSPLDIVTANSNSNSVSVLAGDGAGGFAAAVTVDPGGSHPRSVALGDVNGDGFLDIVTANLLSNDVSVLAGDGAGGFATAVTYATGSFFPPSVQLGDVNGDGFLDIVTANSNSNSVSVLAGDGMGGFAAADIFATDGATSASVALGDVTGDGVLDIVTGNQYSDNVSVLAGDGAGGFAAAVTVATGGDRPYSVALGDVNGDGHLDIVTANYGSANVSVLASDGAGGFAQPVTYATGDSGPVSVTLGDVNGDGVLDIVTANYGSANVSVLAGDGAGGFAAAVTVATGGAYSGSVALGDVTGDGFLDIVTANEGSDNVSVLIGTGAGGFAAAVTVATGGSRPRSVALGDVQATAAFTEDGGAVLIAPLATITDVDDTHMESLTITLISRPDGDGAERLSLNTAAATAATGLTVDYTAATGVLSITGSATNATYQTILRGVQYDNTDQDPDTTDRTVTFVVNDGDRDSAVRASTITVAAVNDAPILFVPTLDIVTANLFSNTVSVLAGFAAAVTVDTGGVEPNSVALDDVNGDGFLDIVTANGGSNDVSVLAGNGTGGFAAAVTFATDGSDPSSVALGDVNGDRLLDIVVANEYSATVSVLAGDGAGGFALAGTFATDGSDPSSVALGDVTGDGLLDIVAANGSSNNVSVLAGNGAGGFARAVTLPTSGIGPRSVALGDVNGDGVLDIVTANPNSANVSVLVSAGAGGFDPAVTVDTGGARPYSVALGDVTGDGFLDIVTASFSSANVSVLAGDGTADGFALTGTFDTGGANPVSVALGDVNGDGVLDIVTANIFNANVSVLAGNGTGGFAAAVTVDTGGGGPVSVALGDVDTSSLHYTENQAAMAINGALLVTDVDSATLTGATVSITGHFHATQDVLGFIDTGAITGSYDADTGVLTLTGTDTLAAYQAALRSVTYFNSSEDPSGDQRTVSYQVDDGAAANHASNIATVTITVAAVNDAPVVFVSPLDIVIANQDSNTVGVLIGTGAGGFAAAATFDSGGSFPMSVALGDMTGDGVLDIVTANAGSVSVLAGAGAGGFAAAATFDSGGAFPYSVALGDVTGDGFLDIVTANLGSDTVSVLAGDGAGGFAPAVTFDTGGAGPVSVALGDVTGDGVLDIVAANASSDSVGVLIGTGTGGFGAAVTYATGGAFPRSVALGDVNGDGFLDLVTANTGSNTVGVLAGASAGVFGAAVTYATGGANLRSVALGDVTGDGFLDLVTANAGSNTVGVLVGDGAGGFAAAVTVATGGSFPVSVALGDVNGDGFLDIVTANQTSANVSVLTGAGAGSFAAAVTLATGGFDPRSVALGDVEATAAFTEDGGAVLIAPLATIADLDDANMESLTITLTNRPDGSAESLSLNSAAATAASSASLTVTAYNATTGELLISGSATKAVYESILQGVRYNNTDQDPNTSARTVNVVVSDGDRDSAVSTSTITVVAVNDAPTSTNDAVTTNEDTTIVLALTDFGNYADIDFTAIAAVKITTLESNGSLEYGTTGTGVWAAVTLNQEISATDITAGKLRFVPDADENGTPYATIGFKVSDGTDFSVAAYTLTVNVTAVPDIVADTVTTTEDTAIVFNPVAGTNGAEADNFEGSPQITHINSTAIIAGGSPVTVTNGAVSLGTDNVLTFTPAADFNGLVPVFSYTVLSGGASETANIDVTVTAVPDIVADTVTTNEDTAIMFNPVAGTNGAEADNFEGSPQITHINGTAIIAGGSPVTVTNGAVSLGTGNVLTFTPAADFNGLVPVFSYTVLSGGASETANIDVTVTAVPDIVADTVTTNEDTAIMFNPVAGTNGAEADNFEGSPQITHINGTAIIAGGSPVTVTNGAVSLGTGNVLTFTPAADFNGLVPVFSYTVLSGGASETANIDVTVTAVPDIVADTVTTNEDTAIMFNPVAGTNGAEADNFEGSPQITHINGTAIIAGGSPVTVTNGAVSLGTGNVLTFTPAADFNGLVPVFSYTVLSGGASETANIDVTVTAVPDIVADTVTTNEDTAIMFNPVAGTNGAEADNFEGSPQITHINGTAIIAGGSPVTVTNGAVSLGTGNVLTFTPAADFNGLVPVFSYTVLSGGASETANIDVTVTAVPDIVADTVTTNEDTAIMFNPVAGTNGAEADNFEGSPQITHINSTAITAGGSPVTVTNGAVSLGTGNVLTFTPATDFNSGVTFTYTVLSGGASETANIDVTVTAVPDIVADTVTTNEDTAIMFNPVAGTNGAEADNFEGSPQITHINGTAIIAGGSPVTVTNGAVSLGTGNVLTFTPATAFNGAVTFTYTVLSGGASETANIDVTVVRSEIPVVLDLDGDGLEFVAMGDTSNQAQFDFNGDGTKETAAWVGPDDGFLVYDQNNDRIINDGSEIAFADMTAEADTDLEALKAVFDSNHDGRLTAADEQFSSFGVWQDTNGNGSTEVGEFKTLDQMGIASLGLVSDGQSYSAANGQVTVHGEASFTYQDGSQGLLGDVSLAIGGPADSSADSQVGGAGNDTLIGGSGNDQYQFNRGDGQDLVVDAGGDADALAFGSEITPFDLVLSRQVDNLRIAVSGSTDQVTVQNWFSGVSNQVETIQTGNGQTLLSSQVNQLIEAMAGFSSDNGMTWDQGLTAKPEEVQAVVAASWQS